MVSDVICGKMEQRGGKTLVEVCGATLLPDIPCVRFARKGEATQGVPCLCSIRGESLQRPSGTLLPGYLPTLGLGLGLQLVVQSELRTLRL